jgi:hypothetical protein
MFPTLSIDELLAIITRAVEQTLGPEAAAQEIKRVRDLVAADRHRAHSLLTEVIRQWRTALAQHEAARIAARYS